MKGVLAHHPSSIYDDFPEERYQFPKRYLNRLKTIIGDWIIYYEPGKHAGGRVYKATAQIQDVIPDPSSDMYLAIIRPGTYLPFERNVPYNEGGRILESGLRLQDGNLDRGAVQWAVRHITETSFADIVRRGLVDDDAGLPRIGDPAPLEEFNDPLVAFDGPRVRVPHLTNRPYRDRLFRKLVIQAYDSTCALTGLRLINGGGRVEAEAAHIKPVERDGPDVVRNGLALSGTVHWMFDRGLIALADDLKILVSRQVNNPEAIYGMLNATRYANPPLREQDRPHPKYLTWHRDFCFKG